MSRLEAAIATRLPCFPCGALKRPTIPGPGGYKHATSDPAELRALWRRYPGALVGVRTVTASGLSALDIDGVKHPEAEIWLAKSATRSPSEFRSPITSSSLATAARARCRAAVRAAGSAMCTNSPSCSSGSARFYAAIGELIERGEPANPVTVRPFFEREPSLAIVGSKNYLVQFVDSASFETISNAPFYARRIVELSQARDAIAAAQDGPSARPSETELRRGEAATCGERPRPRLRLISRWPIIKDSLRGYATVEMPVGLKINDVPVLIGTKGAWPSLPAKPQLTADGRHKVGADGKPAYAAVLE